MRILLCIALLCTPLALGLEGFCTGQYLEQGPNWQQGIVQKGDIFEYWCELPEGVEGHELIDLYIEYTNAELAYQLLTPRVIYGTGVTLFP